MKGITRKLLIVIALVSTFGLVSCSSTPVNDGTDPGTTDPGTTDPGTTDPGTTPEQGFVVQLIASKSAARVCG